MKSGLLVGLGVFSMLASLCGTALANGGPFIVKYPSGDPAAKGVLARLDRSLKPAGESELEVVREDLRIRFVPDLMYGGAAQAEPVAEVTAEYRIRNPTSSAIQRDFGFPILRGIYMSPFAMVPMPDVNVMVDGAWVSAKVISNSGIYGIIRGRAREAIDAGISSDKTLAEKVAALAKGGDVARDAIEKYLAAERKWSASEAALFSEYVALVREAPTGAVGAAAFAFGGDWFERDPGLAAAKRETAKAVRMIGELKATQWLSILAGKFNPETASAYEEIFGAWGGDVRERSVDAATGKVRPREFVVSTQRTDRATARSIYADPTVYARVDYLGATNGLGATEIGRWRRVLKELPVVFTFAPMNLLYYQAAFPAGAERTVTVTYRQYPFIDTKGDETFQLSYVVHPASLWKSFGPIKLSVVTPNGVKPVASVELGAETAAASNLGKNDQAFVGGKPLPSTCRQAMLADKRGELLIGFRKSDWQQAIAAAVGKADTAKK